MIKFKNDSTHYPLSEKDVNESITTLVIFCIMNKGSKQVKKVKKHLVGLEKAIYKGKFKN